MQLPHCPKCHSEYTYEDGGMFICPECAHEWNNAEPADDNDALVVKDANGNLLADGDSVTVVKDLKVKGSSSMLRTDFIPPTPVVGGKYIFPWPPGIPRCRLA